jgi:hypothetical protein
MIGMSDEKSSVTPMRLTAAIAQARIQAAAKVTANVKLSFHAREQMATREIFDVDVFRVLRTGFVDNPPEQTEFEGEWKCKITLKIRGGRTAGVVVIILPNGKLFVKTVEWEDL